MTVEEFTQEVTRLAKLADAGQPFSEERAVYLDQLGNFWEKEGAAFYQPEILKVIVEGWRAGATICRRQA